MKARLQTTALFLLLALGASAGAAAQSRSDSAWLPVWNKASGKLEAYLVLEPAKDAQVPGRWRFGNNTLDATYGLEGSDSLAVLCNGKGNFSNGLGQLPNNCLLATLGERLSQPDRRVSAGAAFTRNGNRVGAVAGSGRDTLPAWLTPGAPRAKMDVKDLTVFAQKDLPNLGYVSIAGTVARARLVPASEASPDLADRWSSKSVTVGGGIGAFGASVVGHVLDTPGQPAWSGLGVGLTWRTPWSGELTVGADNVVTRGKNPFSVGSDDNEGTVPYVRYEQDL
jgi:hypothetical protein